MNINDINILLCHYIQIRKMALDASTSQGGLAYFMVFKSELTRPKVLNRKTDIGGHKGRFYHFL